MGHLSFSCGFKQNKIKILIYSYLNISVSNHILIFITDRGEIMPAMDLALIQSLGRDLHSHSPGYMGEDEVCPWTLFLTMALTLLKG